MAPGHTQALLSPAELAYLHSSLALAPPIRPDSRLPTQFRPLIAETDVLPGANGSARICFPDGTEAIVGVKAEVERSGDKVTSTDFDQPISQAKDSQDVTVGESAEGKDNTRLGRRGAGEDSWVEMGIDIPGFRDDDPLPVFLATMLNEALITTRELVDKLWINRRWHWKLYIDILLLSPPLSYPIPLLSLTTHLALLSTRLPALKSELDEDPLFNDDWDAALPLYPRTPGKSISRSSAYTSRPAVTLLVMAVGTNVFFDPTREELAVADMVLAVSLGISASSQSQGADNNPGSVQLLSIRTIDPPSRLTAAGVSDGQNSAAGGTAPIESMQKTTSGEEGVWSPPQGGMKRELIGRILEMCLKKGGVGEEVLAGLEAVDVG